MKRILNLGCGEDLYGTDRIDFVKTSATTKVCDFEKKLPFKENTFDEVYCKSVLEHIRNLKTFLDEIYRVLKSGGKLYIRTDHSGYLPVHLSYKHKHNKSLHYEYQDSEDKHYHHFVESHLRYLFKRFKIEKIVPIYGGGNNFKRILSKLLPKRLGVVHLDLYATKL